MYTFNYLLVFLGPKQRHKKCVRMMNRDIMYYICLISSSLKLQIGNYLCCFYYDVCIYGY